MLRRISTKWLLAVLAAVVVPCVGFAWYVNTQMGDRMWDVVRYYLQSIAGDLADQLDRELHERRLDVELLADAPIAGWAVGDVADEGVDPALRTTLQSAFDSFIQRSEVFDLLLAVDSRGRLAVSNTVDASGKSLPSDVLARLAEQSYAGEPWFQSAMSDGRALVDKHVSVLLPLRKAADGPHPENFHVGIAARIEEHLETPQPIGVIFGLVNWRYFQSELLRPRREYFQGLIGPDIYASSYAWLWKSDADTIIGHPRRDLYGKKVSEDPVNLPELVEAARKSDWGMYPEYTFDGERKNAAFKHCKGAEEGGLGWVVGIGIDNEDIYETVDDLKRVLWTATLSLLAVVVVWTILIARRTTRPILELQRHTQKVAGGDLNARIVVDSKDELGQLADAFNTMTEELLQSRERLVKAEKDAAWREMARQVAHEIKNPLTPISLSANLLRRAREEKSKDFDEIFERTMDLILRQVEAMRTIAADFYAFAGAHKPNPEPVDVSVLLDEIIELNAAWADELGITVERRGSGGLVFADRGELRRVLINLVSNAFEAMSDGGELTVEVRGEDDFMRISIADTGHGLSEEARGRLFEPYFTTRSHGTGLGLAISRRLVEEMGGEIELATLEGKGTVAILKVPRAT